MLTINFLDSIIATILTINHSMKKKKKNRQVAPAFRGICDLEIGRIGTIVHELIHPFGLPDLYDMDGGYGTGNIGGIDRFGVMANPTGNSNSDLAWPGHVSGWTREQLGWVEPTVIDTDGVYELRPVEQFPDMYKITKGFAENEYLLLENRQPIDGDFDEKFFSPGGIVIYHIDENVWEVFDSGGNTGNFPRGGPFLSGWPGNGKHYPVAVLQADGLYELEQGINGGKSDDLWNQPGQVLGPGNGEKVASSANYPNTDSYAFGEIKTTGITIKNFQTKGGSTMSFQICGLSGSDCTDIVTPDNPTNAPTMSPTESSFEELENGSCEIAVDAFRPDDSLKGISNITSGTIGNTCYGEDETGVWYKVDAGSVADGETIQANTCFSETESANKISVFKGGNCTALECVETKEIACKNGHPGHVVYWEVGKDEDYHLFVHSVKVEDSDVLFDGVTGVSTLGVNGLGDGSVFMDVFNFSPIGNDDCIAATKLSTDGNTASGSTKLATPESNVTSSDTCGIDSAGVWYKVVGTGSELRATTCHPGTNSPTQIHVFSGSCDSLSCISVEANNYAVCSDFDIATNSATVNWETEEGEEYFILVGSRDGSGGEFILSVSEFTPTENDQCPNAIPFDISETAAVITGSTEDATNDYAFGSEYCGAPLDTAGVWYTVEGTGDGLSVSTCGQNDYNSAISIFTGSDCGKLECLTGIATRDPACEFNGVTAAWLSKENEIYHVYVHGSAQNSYGSFELEASKFENKVENGFCNQAIPITDKGVYVKSSTLEASHSAPTNVCGAEAVKPGLWYTFEGTGGPFLFSGCPLDDIDISVSFFKGADCGELSCISGTTYTVEDCAVLENDIETRFRSRFLQGSGNPADFTSIDSEVGVTYYMVIHGQGRVDPETGEVTTGIGGFDFKFFEGEILVPPPTAAPTENDDEGNGEVEEPTVDDEGNGGDGNSDTDSDIPKEDKKFDRRTIWYIVLGVALLSICVFCIPPCWIYRRKICRCCFKSDEDEDDQSWRDGDWKPPNDLDMEEAPFHDERSSKQESATSSVSTGKKHKWQTLSMRSS